MTSLDGGLALVLELDARQQIHDAIVRFARGADRCDKELMHSAFHDGAWDDHGMFAGNIPDLVEWADNLHRDHFVWTSHYITNEYVEFIDDVAHAETYVQAVLRFERDGDLFDLWGSGRYLDKFECRDGRWKIVHRLSLSDWNRVDKVVERPSGELIENLKRGTRAADDLSYQYFGRNEPIEIPAVR